MKPFRSLHLSLALGLTCTLIATGCQDRTTRVPFIFQISPEFGSAAVVPTGRTPVTDPAVPKHLGVITVNIQGFLSDLSKKRRVLATVADVSYVNVMVKAADGAEFSQLIQKAAITNGQTTATFSGLAPGDATVTMKAFDATGRALGSTTQTAAIVAGQNIAVNLTLTLDPTYTGGSGGGTAPTTGSLTANGTLVDGAVINGPAPAAGVGSFDIMELSDFDIDPQGNLWVSEGGPADNLVTYSPSGAIIRSERVGGDVEAQMGPAGSAFGADGSRWLITQDWKVIKYDADGDLVASDTSPLGFYGFWVLDARVAPDGSLWICGGDEFPNLYHVPAGGGQMTMVGDFGLVTSFDFDSQGNVWAVGSEPDAADPGPLPNQLSHLYKFSPNGTLLSRHARKPFDPDFNSSWHPYTGVALDDSGTIWYTDMPANLLCSFNPTTNAITQHFVGMAPEYLVRDANQRLWVKHRDGVSRISAQGQVAETVPIKGIYNMRAGASGVWGMTILGTSTAGATTLYHISH